MNRLCEERSDAAIHALHHPYGLPRFARKDGWCRFIASCSRLHPRAIAFGRFVVPLRRQGPSPLSNEAAKPQKRGPSGPPPSQGNTSLCQKTANAIFLGLPRQRLHHIVPMVEVAVKCLHRNPFVAAVRAFVGGDDDPCAINAVNGHAATAQEQPVSRAG